MYGSCRINFNTDSTSYAIDAWRAALWSRLVIQD